MSEDGGKKLIDAIEKNDTVMASSLISSGVVNLNGNPFPPLCRAAECGRVAIMTMLLDAGVNINAVERRTTRNTACHIAIQYCQFDALKLLVERGADLSVVDSNGRSLLSIVAEHDADERFVILLLDAGAPIDRLSSHLLPLVKSVAVFNRLLSRNIDLTAIQDEIGGKLCHHVARNVTLEDDVRFLVNVCGTDAVHAVNNYGKTPLHWAAAFSNESAMRILVEFGAEIDRQDGGRTALIDACVIKALSSRIELLIALGADVRLADNNGQTGCHFAALYERPVSLCALVAGGSDLDQPNNKGETPRMIAIRKEIHLPTADEIDVARQRIAKTRLDLVRQRAFQICLGLHPLNIDALRLCEILMHSFGALGSLIAFHQWWKIATIVKHFHNPR
jgi:ankyrin repeat protein